MSAQLKVDAKEGAVIVPFEWIDRTHAGNGPEVARVHEAIGKGVGKAYTDYMFMMFSANADAKQ